MFGIGTRRELPPLAELAGMEPAHQEPAAPASTPAGDACTICGRHHGRPPQITMRVDITPAEHAVLTALRTMHAAQQAHDQAKEDLGTAQAALDAAKADEDRLRWELLEAEHDYNDAMTEAEEASQAAAEEGWRETFARLDAEMSAEACE